MRRHCAESLIDFLRPSMNCFSSPLDDVHLTDERRCLIRSFPALHNAAKFSHWPPDQACSVRTYRPPRSSATPPHSLIDHNNPIRHGQRKGPNPQSSCASHQVVDLWSKACTTRVTSTHCCIWNTSNGTQVSCFEGHDGSVKSVEYSPDSSYIVSGGVDATIREWPQRQRQFGYIFQ